MLRVGRRKRCVLVSIRWLRLIERSGEEAVYPMQGIEKAKWTFLDGSVKIDARFGGLLTSIDNRYFRARARGKKLADAINEYKQRDR